MKTHILFLTWLIACSFQASGIKLTVSNPNPVAVENAPVIIRLDNLKKIKPEHRALLAVFVGNEIVSSQFDDLNRDGIVDELVFLMNLKAGEKKEISLRKISQKKRPAFPAEVYASLIFKKEGGVLKHVEEISSEKNDMYNKMHHHGVAFESDKMAYRIYFDNKSTIDLYGKKKYQLELAKTNWYPTDSMLAQGFGDDILLVSDWVGAGTVKGFDGQKATHIDKFDKRTQRILSVGNIRAIAESEIQGWNYEGKKIDMTVRYILYARHRDVVAEVRASQDISNLATGVQQIGGGPCFQSNQLVGSWGTWFPQPDTVKYSKETVGLGVYMPVEYQGKQKMEGVNNLIIFPYKAGTVARFHITAVAAKEENQAIQNAESFFKHLDAWRKGLLDLIVE